MAVMSDEDSAQLKADCAFSMRNGVKKLICFFVYSENALRLKPTTTTT
jgi:hypothetical protein